MSVFFFVFGLWDDGDEVREDFDAQGHSRICCSSSGALYQRKVKFKLDSIASWVSPQMLYTTRIPLNLHLYIISTWHQILAYLNEPDVADNILSDVVRHMKGY